MSEDSPLLHNLSPPQLSPIVLNSEHLFEKRKCLQATYIIIASILFLAATPLLWFLWTGDREKWDRENEKTIGYVVTLIVIYSCRFLSIVGMLGACYYINVMVAIHAIVSLVILLPLMFLVIYGAATWWVFALYVLIVILLVLSGIYGLLFIKSN